MTYQPPRAFFNAAARGQILGANSLIRQQWPKAAAFVNRKGQALARWIDGFLPDRQCIQRQYKAFVGEPLNLDRPRLLSEKVQWLKLHDVTPLHTICADKVRSRDYVREKVGEEYLIPALHIGPDTSGINPDTIRASRFAAKSNHDWGGVVLCRDRETFDWEAARTLLSAQMRKPFWKVFRERAYKDIVPMIIVEAFLEGADGGLPRDYKFFCFHGQPVMVQVVDGRDDWPTWTLYDLDWTKLPVWRRGRPRADWDQARPASLEKMIEIAAELSKPFRFCRIDLYEVDGHIYFGEISFYPEAGYRPFEPLEFERELGDRLHLA
jgi:hypothetical protein